MEHNNSTTKQRTWKQISYDIRLRIEKMCKKGLSAKDIAFKIGYSTRTVQREIKCGLVNTLRTVYDEYATVLPNMERQHKTVTEYSADVAQQAHEAKGSCKGKQLKIGRNFELVEYLEEKIGKGKRSPYAALEEAKLEKQSFAGAICVKTVYNYLDMDLFLNISNKDLWTKKKPKKRKYANIRHAYTNVDGRKIEERPKAVAERKEYGHWEMDTVVGKGKTTLLVLTERKTRQEIIRKMPSKSQKAVIKALDIMERKIGAKEFREKFKTITMDNGCEFLCQEGIERSCLAKKQRTMAYFCHPYSAFERGSNENANKLIRRFIPKGADISKYTEKEIRRIEHYINNYPRKILGGAPPRMAA